MRKMRIRTIAVVATGVTVLAAVRAIRRRRRRFLSRHVRKAMTELLGLRAEDFVPAGSARESIFHRHVQRLDDRQLLALFVLVQVGHFVRSSNINILHPSKEDLARAVREYVSLELVAPQTRELLLDRLQREEPHVLRDALMVAFGLLARA